MREEVDAHRMDCGAGEGRGVKLMSNSLTSRAECIRSLVAESDAAAATGIEKALEAGHALVSAKDDCKHGEWLPFLERAGVQERKAQRLMKLAKSGLKSDTVSDLGIMGALRFISLREQGFGYMDRAYASVCMGDNPLHWLELSMAKMDKMIELFPEEKRTGLERYTPEEDVVITALRMQAAAVG